MHRLTLVNQHTFNEQQDLLAASYISAPADFSRADNENDITLVQQSDKKSEIVKHSQMMDQA